MSVIKFNSGTVNEIEIEVDDTLVVRDSSQGGAYTHANAWDYGYCGYVDDNKGYHTPNELINNVSRFNVTNDSSIIQNDGSFKIQNGSEERKAFGRCVLLYRVNATPQFKVVKKCDYLQRLLFVPTITTSILSTDSGNVTYYFYNTTPTNLHAQIKIIDKNGLGVSVLQELRPWIVREDYNTNFYNPLSYIHNQFSYDTSDQKIYAIQFDGIYGNQNRTKVYTPLIEEQRITSNKNFKLPTDERFLVKYETPYYFNNSIDIYVADEELLKFYLACFGLKFMYKDVVYKPIVENGVVVGYTDDMTTQSEWDSWKSFDDHDIPVTPPTPTPPTPSGDDVDDMTLGFEGYENGFIKHYQVTSGNLQTISQKIAEDTEHLNAIDNIVSLKSYVIPTSYFIASSTSDRINISGIDTTVDAPKITVTKSDYEIGSTTVSGKYGSASNPHFLDFTPYTQLECYIPFCGVVQLPDWVMYKTIHVILVSDIITGSCKGIVKCNGDIVAEKVGVLGIDAPFTSEANALKNSAMLQTVLNGANIGMQTLGSGLSGSYTGITKGALQGIANIQQSIIAGNNNYTVSVGSSPDRIEYAMPSACYIKKYFPVKEEPENYLHTIGKPLMKKKTISEVSGYTVCSNVDTSSITCTEQEREMIKNILESGVYL